MVTMTSTCLLLLHIQQRLLSAAAERMCRHWLAVLATVPDPCTFVLVAKGYERISSVLTIGRILCCGDSERVAPLG